MSDKEQEIYDIVKNLFIMKNLWTKQVNYRPIKNTSKKEIYRAILKIQKILNVPYRNYNDIY